MLYSLLIVFVSSFPVCISIFKSFPHFLCVVRKVLNCRYVMGFCSGENKILFQLLQCLQVVLIKYLVHVNQSHI